MRAVWLLPTGHTPAQFIHMMATRMRHHLSAALFVATVAVVNAAQADKYYSSDGVRIRFVEQGAGEPIVLIHGLLGSIDDWRRTTRVLDDLSRDHRVIALDLRGHGQSDKPRDPAAYGARLTEDVLRLLDHLKIERAHIVGYSVRRRRRRKTAGHQSRALCECDPRRKFATPTRHTTGNRRSRAPSCGFSG